MLQGALTAAPPTDHALATSATPPSIFPAVGATLCVGMRFGLQADGIKALGAVDAITDTIGATASSSITRAATAKAAPLEPRNARNE